MKRNKIVALFIVTTIFSNIVNSAIVHATEISKNILLNNTNDVGILPTGEIENALNNADLINNENLECDNSVTENVEEELNEEDLEEKELYEEEINSALDKENIENNLPIENENSGNSSIDEEDSEENLENNEINSSDEIVPLEAWEGNKPLIDQVIEKTGISSIQKVTYEDLKTIKMLNLNFVSDIPDIISNFTGLVVLNLHNIYFTDGNMDQFIELISQISGLKELTLSANELTALPDCIGNLKELEYLDISGNKLGEVPEILFELPNLKDINLSGNGITYIPSNINDLSNLESLELRGNSVVSLPEGISQMSKMRYLGLSRNDFSEFPTEILSLTALETLDLSVNKLTKLPDDLTNMDGDKTFFNLIVSNNQIYSLPKVSTQKIKADNNFVEFLSNGVPVTAQLKLKNDVLKIDHSKVPTQSDINNLVEVYRYIGPQYNPFTDLDSKLNLDIVINNEVVSIEDLSQYPKGVYSAKLKINGSYVDNPYSETYETLKIVVGDAVYEGDDDVVIPDDATGVIPKEYWQNNVALMINTSAALGNKAIDEITFEDLTTITRLELYNQHFKSIPKLLTKYTNLESLILSGNNFTQIPKELYDLSNLQELHLGSNNITAIPDEISKLKKLKVLGLSYNNISSISTNIKYLTNLENLYLNNNKEIGNALTSIYSVTSLNKLSLGSCNLTRIDDEISNLVNLEHLEIDNNQLLEVNDFIKSLPVSTYSNNFIDCGKDGTKKLVLDKTDVVLNKGDLTNQEFLNSLFKVKIFQSEIYAPKPPEDLNKNHTINFIVNGKEVLGEELSKYPNGEYKIYAKIKGSSKENTYTVADDVITLKIDGNITEENTNDNVNNNNNLQLPNTGGSNSMSLYVIGTIIAVVGIKLNTNYKRKTR